LEWDQSLLNVENTMSVGLASVTLSYLFTVDSLHMRLGGGVGPQWYGDPGEQGFVPEVDVFWRF
jgi:hypothetical protein